MDALRPHPTFKSRPGPLVLCIMDGVGYGPAPEGDAVANACKPTLDWLTANCPHTRLKAHGTAVGLPSDEDMGNSEVGHNAIGAGRVFDQGSKLVGGAIKSGALFAGQAWQEITAAAAKPGATLHFIGLLSDGNVHSHVDHLKGLIDQARRQGIKHVRCHLLLDGRDVGETSALDYFDPFEAFLAQHNASGADYHIASGGGRMNITMDRYGANWDMVRRGWACHVQGSGRQFASAHQAIVELRHETKAIDQDLPAFVIAKDGAPLGPIQDGDAVVLFNFRGDRAIELTQAFVLDDFPHFDRGQRPRVTFAGMMQYDGDTHLPPRFLVTPPALDRTLGEYLSQAGVRQFAISETQKFGHVTYFFNGNRSGKFNEELEQYTEIRSDVLPFEQRPWMQAAQVTDAVLAALASKQAKFYRMNYPNGDMVGHTGNYQAAVIAVETVDLCLSRLLPAIKAAGGVLIITADHGNADEMYERNKKSGQVVRDASGKPKAKTSHTLNAVPAIIYDPLYAGEYTITDRQDLGITSITATCLNLLGYAAPADYDPSLLVFK